MEEFDNGRISQWNEGMFKSSRLDMIQVNINYLKANPLKITEGEFNYVVWFRQVELLCDEGYSKYSNAERKEVDVLRELIIEVIENMSPTTFVKNDSMGGSSNSYLIDKERFKLLRQLILKFELRVKDLNDAHGLTTMNQDNDDSDWD
jgi:hypothetical protein